jgi:hypothetical protein
VFFLRGEDLKGQIQFQIKSYSQSRRQSHLGGKAGGWAWGRGKDRATGRAIDWARFRPRGIIIRRASQRYRQRPSQSQRHSKSEVIQTAEKRQSLIEPEV